MMIAEQAEFLMERINACPFNAANGVHAVSVEEGRAVVAVDLVDSSMNIWGIPHGGLLYTLGDVASGLTIHSVHPDRSVTVSSTLNFVRAAGKETRRLTGVGELVKCGRSMAFVQVNILDEAERVLATGQYVFHLS